MRDASERDWERGWDGHSGAQMRRLARLPLAEKLAWLEQAHEIVLHLERARRAREAAEPPTDRP